MRNAVLAAALGSQLTATTFNVANTVPNIVYILLAGGVLNAVFVPQLVRAMRDGAERERAYTDRLLTLAGLVAAVDHRRRDPAPPRSSSASTRRRQLDAGRHAVATAFAFWCLPQIFFYGLYTMLGQVLNARGSFGPMMWAPIVNNVVAIAAGLVFIGRLHRRPGRPDVADRRGEIALLGARHDPRRRAAGAGPACRCCAAPASATGRGSTSAASGLGKAGELARWTLLFVLVNQLAYVVIVNLAPRADARGRQGRPDYGVGFTAYANAYLIFILPHSIITVSVVTGLLPRMSRDAAEGRLAEVRATSRRPGG